MDPEYALPLVLIPIALVVAGFLIARRGRSSKERKSGNLMAAATMGLVALFASWWALGMTIGIWSLDGSSVSPHTFGEILLALALEVFVCMFPLGAWYFCARFAKTALKGN
jgi:hypothetical protein